MLTNDTPADAVGRAGLAPHTPLFFHFNRAPGWRIHRIPELDSTRGQAGSTACS